MGAAPLTFDYRGRRRAICCHRASYSGHTPPNSLASIVECVEAGAPRLEIDVRFLRDDAMLVFHASELDHETTSAGRVDALDAAAAATLRYRDDGEHPVCFLGEVVEAMRGSDTLLQVDLKLMRPISPAREAALATALEPLGERVLMGTAAHWNLAPFVRRGFRVAFDPTLQWHYAPSDAFERTPTRRGVYGLWDDAPLAHVPHATAREYTASRISDIAGLVPDAVEWMVDVGTVRHLASLGCSLGEELAGRGIELAAWTLRDPGDPQTAITLREMLDLGATTVIADEAAAVAALATGSPL